MKKMLTLLFLFSAVAIFSQNILTGTITGKDNTPLEGVNIYYDGTTISTVSDADGKFSIKYEPNANNILVMSSIGYQTEYLSGLDVSKPLNITMKILENELKEVVVNNNNQFTRAQKLKLFREFFLGTTSNAKSAIIKNEDDIKFKYDKKNLLFTASSDKPLVIINPALGYKIDFELVIFEVSFNTFSINSLDAVKNFYGGVSRFEEIDNSAKVLKKREKTFQGSQIQFFRNLANSDWEAKKFLLFKGKYNQDPTKCFKITKEGDFSKVELIDQQDKSENINLNSKKIVAVYNLIFDKKEASKITFETNSFYIYKYGNNSNIEDILFSGKISEKRVGDMLPLNYGIE
ncbi:carboxypeptidase-like regulatory domain-containing protein [Flavobacterium sp. KACC 22761]|uniref:carboxypeptidase-like regulatory domain-containing protein n=1 Tax=Flavobacterium sp. KACC 22761 TaxID=3092665 RepID=UPI002A74EF8D|nr:carboxypeptidase-like regulatory domain-containing protein [Flavobacterium sp. KACC 22761]WPO77948.1 carboxypeptidase-like regulatory domain-containing protein [Flavobacterium sp. KACC 22761]